MAQELLQDPAWMGEAPIVRSETPPGADQVRGQWPRMLRLDRETEDRLKLYIDEELSNFFAERTTSLENWKRWQTVYWAEPEKKEKNFPFKRAANVVIPLAAVASEAIHARMMNTLFSVEPFWSIRPRNKAWVDSAKPFERYLQAEAESSQTLKVQEFCHDSILELVKLGTAIGKSGYRREFRKSMRVVVDDIEEELWYEAYNGATLERVPLANFLLRLSQLDPQQAPWVGEEHEYSWSQLKRLAQSGQLDGEAIKKVSKWWVDTSSPANTGDSSDYKKHVQQLADAEPLWSAMFRFQEIWMSFDVDGDGYDEEIVLDYHKPSRTLLSIRYNWNDDLHRPYHICNFVRVEGVWVGIGVCKQSEQFQEEITTIHRQRLDNATLANMTTIVIRKGSGYGPNEPIYPGKMWFLDDVKDIQPFKLSEVYPSSFANEESAIRYWEKRTGASEVILGESHQGTPGTATSDLTRLAEGNKRFDLVLRNVRRWMSNLGYDIIANYQRFGNQEAHWWVEGEDGLPVEQVLRMPSVLVRKGAVVDLTVTDSITNRDVEQRQWLSLFQLVTNYYDRVLQLVQILGDPQLFGAVGQRALVAGDELLRRLMETFNITDTDRFALAAGTEGSNGVEQPTGPAVGGPTNGLIGPGSPTGLAALPPSGGRGGGQSDQGTSSFQ